MKPLYRRGFQKWLAESLGITEPLMSMIIREKRAISIDIAERLVKQFPETQVEFWLNMPLLSVELCLWRLGRDQYIESIKQAEKGTENDED